MHYVMSPFSRWALSFEAQISHSITLLEGYSTCPKHLYSVPDFEASHSDILQSSLSPVWELQISWNGLLPFPQYILYKMTENPRIINNYCCMLIICLSTNDFLWRHLNRQFSLTNHDQLPYVLESKTPMTVRCILDLVMGFQEEGCYLL
jgi:hypothetical protein